MKRSFSSIIRVDESELDQAKNLKDKFEKSVELSAKLPNVSDENNRKFLALSRQANEGDNNDPKPGIFNMFSEDA